MTLRALFRTSTLLHVLGGEGILSGVGDLLLFDRDELVECLRSHGLLDEAQDCHAALLVLLHQQPDVVD